MLKGGRWKHCLNWGLLPSVWVCPPLCCLTLFSKQKTGKAWSWKCDLRYQECISEVQALLYLFLFFFCFVFFLCFKKVFICVHLPEFCCKNTFTRTERTVPGKITEHISWSVFQRDASPQHKAFVSVKAADLTASSSFLSLSTLVTRPERQLLLKTTLRCLRFGQREVGAPAGWQPLRP